MEIENQLNLSTRKSLCTVNNVDISARYKILKPKPQRANFAAIIENIDLSSPLEDSLKIELQRALADFEVIFLPAQPLSPESHLNLAAVFGEPVPGAFFPRHPAHHFIEVIEFNESRRPEANIWHSDLSWTPSPPKGTVIQIVENPPTGGATSWASMSKAFSELSENFRSYLEGLSACHTWEIGGWREYLGNRKDDMLFRMIEKYPPVSHPIIKINPASNRKCLYVNENFTKHINNIHFRESEAILEFFVNWINQPEFIYTHAWEKNGIAIWDNLSTQHYAAADYYPFRRVTNRVTFC